jgi:hypothetical protein
MRRLALSLLVGTLAACGVDTVATADCSTMTDTFAGYGATFLASQCRTCHAHASQFATQALVAASSSTILANISTREMPEGVELDPETRARVLAWLECGAP